MLLLHSCVRMRADPTMGDAERAQFAMKAWLEIDALESALDHHRRSSLVISSAIRHYHSN